MGTEDGCHNSIPLRSRTLEILPRTVSRDHSARLILPSFGNYISYSNTPHHQSFSTDPSICPLHTSSPIPQCPTCSGPGERRPPGQRWPRAARRTVGGIFCFARATSISPRTTVTPLSYIPQPRNAPNGPKGLHSNKQNQPKAKA